MKKEDSEKIYLAPLQGFTDFVFRRNYELVFGQIDKFFAPYISYFKKNEIRKSQLKDINPDINLNIKLIPQVLFSDLEEFKALCDVLIQFNYTEINLNLGCPYPMATKRGRGAALLQRPDLIKEVLKYATNETDIRFSVKLRSGLTDENDVFSIIDVLNQFDLKEVIYHPRIASQMYKGNINIELFEKSKSHSINNLIYNGDIVSVEKFQELKDLIPQQNSWMIGRGILQNPFLVEEIKNIDIQEDRAIRLRQFHDQMLEDYQLILEGQGHVLQKMKQFWEYYSFSFSDQHKVYKLIKKTTSLGKYQEAIIKIFSEFI